MKKREGISLPRGAAGIRSLPRAGMLFNRRRLTMKHLLHLAAIVFLCTSCAVSKPYDPYKKYTRQELEKDYTIFRSILEEDHPGLYWYTSKDSMDYYFEQGRAMIRDSLTEVTFRNILSYVVSRIGC